jgi:hypothetical protein
MKTRLRALLLAAVTTGLVAGAASSATDPGQSAASADALLRGAIDIHVHSLPDDRPRSIDGIDAAAMAKSKGMRAIVLKDHYESTAGRVYLVRKVVPGIEVFGGIDLNLTVGGMNPAAVEHMTKVTGGYGRFVWMSTFDAENDVHYAKENRPFVSVSKNGELLPETKAVIATIARHANLVIATGHVAPAEGLMILREAHRLGVRHMVVTHAMNPPVVMTVAQMQEAVKEGAFIEFVGGALKTPEDEARMDRFAAAIRTVGAAHCILSSDLGQKDNPLPADGFAAFIAALQKRGISVPDLDRMAKQNPASLLELP